jgi:hypothetical protein
MSTNLVDWLNKKFLVDLVAYKIQRCAGTATSVKRIIYGCTHTGNSVLLFVEQI